MPNFNSLCNFKMDKELCKTCGKLIPKTNFVRHLKSHSDEKKFSCYQCSKKFKTKDQLNCHLQTHRKPEDMTLSKIRVFLEFWHLNAQLSKIIKTLLTSSCSFIYWNNKIWNFLKKSFFSSKNTRNSMFSWYKKINW